MLLITLRELQTVMREFVWEGDWESFERAPDRTFEELGYDSLALLETNTRLKRDHGVELPDEDLTASTTPRRFLELVNALLNPD